MEDTQFNKTIAIVGAGGFGREIESWFVNSNLSKEYNLVGYLDDNSSGLDSVKSDFKIIGDISIETLQKHKNVIVAISNVKVKETIFNLHKQMGGFNILSFYHSSVTIAKFVNAELGFIATPNTVISCNTNIGKGVFVNSGSQIGHDVSIGDYTSIMANVDIGGNAIIGNNVFIGTGAIILPGVKVAANIRIGAGTVVLRNLKKEGTYFGNPAKKIF